MSGQPRALVPANVIACFEPSPGVSKAVAEAKKTRRLSRSGAGSSNPDIPGARAQCELGSFRAFIDHANVNKLNADRPHPADRFEAPAPPPKRPHITGRPARAHRHMGTVCRRARIDLIPYQNDGKFGAAIAGKTGDA